MSEAVQTPMSDAAASMSGSSSSSFCANFRCNSRRISSQCCREHNSALLLVTSSITSVIWALLVVFS